MKKRSGFYPRSRVDIGGAGVVSQAGGVLLTAVIGRVGLDPALSPALARWRKPHAVHDPAKVVLDLAVTLALGGDCLADIALLRSAPGVFGPVASDPTVSRTIDALAADAPAALAAIDAARAAARARAWPLAGQQAPDHDVDGRRPLVIDVDATLVTAHSEKEQAAPTFKRGFGFHPLWAFADHGPAGTGEPLACCSGRATPARTPPPTTSAWSVPRSGSSRTTGRGGGPGGGSWSAPTPAAAPTPSSPGWPGSGCSTRSGSPCPPTSPRCWRRSPSRCGPRPTTPTGRSARGPRSPRSPTCST